MTTVFILTHIEYDNNDAYRVIDGSYESKKLAEYCANEKGLSGYEIEKMMLITRKSIIEKMNLNLESFKQEVKETVQN